MKTLLTGLAIRCCLPVFNTTEPIIPLKINRQANLFKFFLSDIGLLSTLFERATQIKILEKSEDINCGSIFENVVAQELFSHGYVHRRKVYTPAP